MSLMSERERLNRAATNATATNEDVLRAALLASNERYEKMVQEQNARLDRLEASVKASNDKMVVNYAEILKNAATGVLEPFNVESEKAVRRLSAAAHRFDEKSQGTTIFGLSLSSIGMIALLAVLCVLCYQVREFRADLHDLMRMQQRTMWNVTYPDSPLRIGVSDSEVAKAIENQWLF